MMLLKCYLELNEVDKAGACLTRLEDNYPDDINVMLASYSILKKTTEEPDELYHKSVEILDSVINSGNMKNLSRIAFILIENAEKAANLENHNLVTEQVCRVLEASDDKDVAKRVLGYLHKLQVENVISNQELLNLLTKYGDKIEVDKNFINTLEEENIKHQEALLSKFISKG